MSVQSRTWAVIGLIAYPMLALGALFASTFGLAARWVIGPVLGVAAFIVALVFVRGGAAVAPELTGVPSWLAAYLVGLVVATLIVLTGARPSR